MTKIVSGTPVRIYTAEELGIQSSSYRYTNHGGVRMWAAFPAPNNPHVWYLTADKEAAVPVCPWAELEKLTLSSASGGYASGLNVIRNNDRIRELKRKYLGPIALNCLHVVGESPKVEVPIVDVTALCQAIDSQIMVARSGVERDGMNAHDLARHLKSARREGIINYLESHNIPYTDCADDDSFALEA
ncbi:hypothetical protein O152_gp004 [Pseudomonas phage PaBG]|uniref:hypothetical protein n=1 Tax=Pseudomonas phage PaBG TaxID=1335230 RepID=UPI00155EF7D6|nr:hypothetical protein O152_gp004 [Pseudomonas phage PaBG]QKE11200.1 hypothetical protein PaBG_00004 [Pseudomonas phage PaBG]